MKIDSVTDYLSCIVFKILGFFVRKLPLSFSLFCGRRLGELMYFIDTKHRSVAYSNMKTAFGKRLAPKELSDYTKEFYRSFGQTLIEFFVFPLVDNEYLNKYITFDGLDNIASGFKRGKGVILAVVHEGSWEISNIISANLGYPFNIVVRDQYNYRYLNKLLNLYRMQKGSKLIETKNQTRKIIEALANNEALAMTMDQGGKTGVLVKFFGKNASMSTGAVRLALKYGATIVPVFSTRVKGPYMKFILEKPFEVKRTTDAKKDIQDNLERLIAVFEKYITAYPKEYLWTYKIWKYSDEKNILILSDGKTGHLRQAQAAAKIAGDYFKSKSEVCNIKTIEVRFRSKFSSSMLALCSFFMGKYYSRGHWCLEAFLERDSYESISRFKPDIVISCGSSLAALNLIISRQNLAKSVVIMRSSFLSTKKFDLVIIPRHDRPAKRGNIVATAGALNLINEDYLRSQTEAIRDKVKVNKELVVGLLIGGDSKDFRLDKDLIRKVLNQIKGPLDKLDGQLLVSTSRRTSNEVESLLKEELNGYGRCRLFVIANEKNIPEAVGAILGLSRIVITSPESISMISEAVNSKKHVLVFKSPGVSIKHQRFLDLFAENKYIYLVEPGDLGRAVGYVWQNKPDIFDLKDNLAVESAMKRIL